MKYINVYIYTEVKCNIIYFLFLIKSDFQLSSTLEKYFMF